MSPLTVAASTFGDVTSRSRTLPLTALTDTSPETSRTEMSLLTLESSTLPFACASAIPPDTDLSDTYPTPPRQLTSPLTVSAVTAACAPSTSMFVLTPDNVSAIQGGAVITYSTSCGMPRG